MPKGFHHAIETLTIERDSFTERIKNAEDERDHFKKEASGEIVDYQLRIMELNQAIAKLKGLKFKAENGKSGNGKRPKELAKCDNGKSVSWCYQVCQKNKDRSCQLIKFQTRKASKN